MVSCEHVLVDNGKQVYYYAFTYLGCLFFLLTIKKFRLCHYTQFLHCGTQSCAWNL